MSYCEEINARMRQAVLDSGISYQELADKLGIHRETIESLMGTTHGLLGPTLLGELCMALGVSADWVLLGLTDESGKKVGQNNEYEPPNDPLTLAELRQMDGEPVYVKRINNSHTESGWALVHREWCYCKTASGCAAFFEWYGKTWLAYRHKPERPNTAQTKIADHDAYLYTLHAQRNRTDRL